MRRKLGLAASVGILTAGAFMLAAPTPAPAQSSGVKAGSLTCNVSSGWGFVFGSSRSLRCTYSPSNGAPEHYAGTIKKFGVDIGYVSGAVMVWVVVAPAADMSPGALAGDYVGATASASVGVGVGANALIGGSNKSIALQPLSIEGNQGLNVAGGIGAVSLKFQP